MKKKKARTSKRRSTKKRASSVRKRKPATRRRKTTAKRAASRASNPKRKKRRTTKRRAVAKRRAAAPKRRKRRSNPAPAAGYQVRASNPRRKKKRKSSKRGKLTASKLRSMLRSMAKRVGNPKRLTGRVAPRGGRSMGAMSVADIKRSSLLDASSRIRDIEASLGILDDQITQAQSAGLDELVAELEVQRAQMLRQKSSLASGMGLLDAAILSASEGSTLGNLRGELLSQAQKRKREAATRSAISSKFRSVSEQRNAYYAVAAIKAVLGQVGVSSLAQYVPDLQKQYQQFDLETGRKEGGRISVSSIPFPDYNDIDGQSILLMLPPESIALAIRMLQRNYIPTGESGAAARVDLALAMDRLSALMGGRIENPRRGRRRKTKGRKGRRRRKMRASNPGRKRRKKRKSSKRGRRRRKNPFGGLDLIAKLGSSASMEEKGMAALKIAGAASVGFMSLGLVEDLMNRKIIGGQSINDKIASMMGGKPAAAATLSSTVSAALGIAGIWGLGGIKALEQYQASAAIGVGARWLRSVIDANWRGTGNTDKMLRAAVGLPTTVSGYGSWNPMAGYYNFQPVMGALPAAGYQVAMAGAPKAGYTVGNRPSAGYSVSGMKPGYTVNGYANYAPAMSGYANYAPRMGNPMGSPF